jgi:hypothetical protein
VTFTAATTPASGINARTASGQSLPRQILGRSQQLLERGRRSRGHVRRRARLRQNHQQAGRTRGLRHSRSPGNRAFSRRLRQINRSRSRRHRNLLRGRRGRLRRLSRRSLRIRRFSQRRIIRQRGRRNHRRVPRRDLARRRFSPRRRPNSIAMQMRESGRAIREQSSQTTRGNRSSLDQIRDNRSQPIIRGTLRRTISRRGARTTKISGNVNIATTI